MGIIHADAAAIFGCGIVADDAMTDVGHVSQVQTAAVIRVSVLDSEAVYDGSRREVVCLPEHTLAVLSVKDGGVGGHVALREIGLVAGKSAVDADTLADCEGVGGNTVAVPGAFRHPDFGIGSVNVPYGLGRVKGLVEVAVGRRPAAAVARTVSGDIQPREVQHAGGERRLFPQTVARGADGADAHLVLCVRTQPGELIRGAVGGQRGVGTVNGTLVLQLTGRIARTGCEDYAGGSIRYLLRRNVGAVATIGQTSRREYHVRHIIVAGAGARRGG